MTEVHPSSWLVHRRTPLRLNPLEKRVPVALAVAAGLPAGAALRAAHRLGRGI